MRTFATFGLALAWICLCLLAGCGGSDEPLDGKATTEPVKCEQAPETCK